MMVTVRVVLPAPLRALANLGTEIAVAVPMPGTLHEVIDALEAAHPALRGTIRDRSSRRRRAFIRFYACAQDWSHSDMAAPLPPAVRSGAEPLLIVGAMAGG